MYEIIKQINNSTALALKGTMIYILKKIEIGDMPVYKSLKTVNSPNVAKIYGFTTIGDNFYAVEEHIQGITLKEFVDGNVFISDDTAAKIAIDICNGLRALHEINIVHRDITPTNIMIDSTGRAVIIDFGISRFMRADRDADTQILGTHGFAAPEQYGFSQTGARSDIYSLGVLINFILTKSMPNEALAGGRLGMIVKKCIEIDENNRYSSIKSLKNALERRDLKNIAFTLPGLNSKNKGIVALAAIYYGFIVLIIIGAIGSAINAFDGLCLCMFIIFTFVLPVFIIFNYMGWQKRLKPFRTMNKRSIIAFKILFVVISLIISATFIMIAPVST